MSRSFDLYRGLTGGTGPTLSGGTPFLSVANGVGEAVGKGGSWAAATPKNRMQNVSTKIDRENINFNPLLPDQFFPSSELVAPTNFRRIPPKSHSENLPTLWKR